MTSKEVRKQFIDFFKSNGHSFVRSSSVVPFDDPTLLFTNAGMNQFKPVFLGGKTAENVRVVNSQKCIRVSGKHNDLEEVGVDDYHHTFFEMLGNWSFGDYYKQEAIEWAWELLTEVWKLDKTKLWVTIFQDDDESRELWKKCTDIPEDRILKFGHKDNFWEMGDVGPCGPCTEIHYYTGDDPDDQKASGVNADPEYREIWNLVFIQYNRDEEGNLNELPEKHVDTGAGLERITAILNRVTSNYDTDLFIPIIEKISELANFPYTPETGVAHRVISDHVRMLAFSIADGAIPGNDGRGYVLRRVLRRAARFGRTIGLTKPFISSLIPPLTEIMGDSFPELVEKQSHIKKVISAEEKSFGKTLDKGLDIFDSITEKMHAGDTIAGEDAFKLYDTFGFPVDLTALMAREKELTIDNEKFELLMEDQKARARKAGKFRHNRDKSAWIILSEGESNCFSGYEESESEAQIRKYRIMNGKTEIIIDKTPFYAEQGGQIGDTGKIWSDNFSFDVEDTFMDQDDIVHYGTIETGKIEDSINITAKIDSTRRQNIRLNHTATHLLHQSMKVVLGDHVHQAGSLVAPDRLRFDYTHSEKLSKNEKLNIEELVNVEIRKNSKIDTTIMDYDSARKSGAVAQFGEKYGDVVRVVNVPGFSTELCGGTHVTRTGDIGAFKIISDSSLASGVRRIEAVTGSEFTRYISEQERVIQLLKEKLNCSINQIPDRVDIILDEKLKLEKQLKSRQSEDDSGIINELLGKSEEINGVQIIVCKIDVSGDLMEMGDILREQSSGKFVALLGMIRGGKPMVLCAISDSLVDTLNAGKIVKEVGGKMGGGGGGKAHLAQAGGKNSNELETALEFGKSIIIQKLTDEKI